MTKKYALSVEGIADLVKDVEAIRLSLQNKVDVFCEELAKIGVNTAAKVLTTDSRTENDSVTYTREGNGEYLVVAQGSQVAFIEFGVGVVGESGGYPANKLLSNWHYNEMRSPWAHDSNDPTFWYYYDNEQVLHRTRGTVPVGFMNTAGEEVRQRVHEVAKRVFSQ